MNLIFQANMHNQYSDCSGKDWKFTIHDSMITGWTPSANDHAVWLKAPEQILGKHFPKSLFLKWRTNYEPIFLCLQRDPSHSRITDTILSLTHSIQTQNVHNVVSA